MSVFVAGAVSLGELLAAPKPIRLRNEIIQTEAPAFAPAAPLQPLTDRAVSGLYLIQFTDHLQDDWKTALRSLRVELLQYVPEDAFVAKLDEVSVRQVEALPFIRWVGAYRPEHKLHPALRPAAGFAPANDAVSITVLLSPQATPAEMAEARGSLQGRVQEARPRFGAVLRGKISRARLARLSQSPGVLWMEPGPQIKLFDEIAAEIVAGEGDPSGHGTFTQDFDFDGRGVTVAVADSGLHTGDTNTMHPDLFGRVNALFYYGNLENASDEHSHGTHVAGIVAGNGATGEEDEIQTRYGVGVASGASIVVQRLFDGAGGYEAPSSFEVLTHDAVRAGAEIGSNSWGEDTQGRYDVSAAEFDALVRDADAEVAGDQQYILEFSAGNAGPGPQTIGSPAVAKNVIATGASQNNRFDFFIYAEGQDAMADFSSRGPCEDGRIKPDVVAPGTWIASLRSPYGDDNNAWGEISENYLYQGGTSQAGPQVSGAAAVFVQYYRQTYAIGTPSPALVKAALINSAVDMFDESGTTPTPNMDEGWGRVDLTEVILSESVHEYVDQTALLTTGQTYDRQIIIASTNLPLKITLVYTDVPGFPAAIPALVNDLDLELIAPDGRVYRGNQFEQGESVPDAPSFDSINNVEGIYVAEPPPGEYRVRVFARNVAQDARRDTPALDQDFALVIAGEIPPPETGSVLLNRSSFRAPDRIQIKVIDLDLAAEPSVAVTVRSTTEPSGEIALLLSPGGTGVLTGSIATATGPALANGVLNITHGDTITIEYFDSSEGSLRIATAVADMIPPVVSNVAVTNRFGQTFISWITDEPANAFVRFGTNATLNRSASQTLITFHHEVELTNLVVGRTYFFQVESSDLAGNLTVTNNSGQLFSFVAQPAATVLLVDAYINDPEAPFLPVSTYTDTLSQIGVSHDVWDVNIKPMPTLANLRPYQIVMWRINDSFYRSDSIPTAQQNVIQQYLNGGGSFFMASMEILSRLGSVPFRTNVLQVQQFTTNPDPFNPCPACDEDTGVPAAEGVANDPIGAGLLLTFDYTQFPEIDFLGIGPDLGDVFTPSTNAASVLLESFSQRPCGVRFPRTGQDSTGRVVFLSFPLEAVPPFGPPGQNRASLLRNVIQFLKPGLDGVGTIALDANFYRLPDLLALEVADEDQAGQPGAFARLWTDSEPNPITVVLHETPRSGLFRALVPIVATTNSSPVGTLRAQHGDTIHAEYVDNSSGAILSITAEVDAVVPVIFDRDVQPEFDGAIVRWSTSEATDALVQFGESAFLGRTAYGADLEFEHQLTLDGLTPDRTYYYQIVSRDEAGNTVVDDNGGQLYTFQTKLPLRPPLFDDFESGPGDWTTFNGEDSLTEWKLGSPNNTVESSAYSPLNCWASSLLGENIDTADTFLISPAIELTGGNISKLRFWHRYDFSERTTFDLLEFGQLLIITNSLTAPVPLAEYYDDNFFWEQEEIDLTPYVGRVVFLVWHHQLLAFESARRPGWLVDDIEITITNIPPGTVHITNNLAQGRYLLGGPISRSGQGWNTTFTNATPGEYNVTFSTVPYYLPPAAQTNTLPPGGTIAFVGTYTFPDINTNQMSDTWEMQFFGNLSPTRNLLTDTDGDGFPDYAEFIAGTNPGLTNSFLRLMPPVPEAGGQLRIQWFSIPGRAYQVQATTNLAVWNPVSGWIHATSGITILPLPSPGVNFSQHYRLEVRP